MSVPLKTCADKNWITARWACLEESLARSLTVYLVSASVNNTLPLSSIYQISPDIHCHLPGKSQSSTAGNNGAPTSVPLSLGHALYIKFSFKWQTPFAETRHWLPSRDGIVTVTFNTIQVIMDTVRVPKICQDICHGFDHQCNWCAATLQLVVVSYCTGSGRNTWRFCKTAVSGTAGVGNLSLSDLLARLKAFQLPWSTGL